MKTRVTRVRPAGRGHAVTTLISSGGSLYRREVCAECPWRKDQPAGAFPPDAYRHSAATAYDAAFEKFGCHMSGGGRPATCAGFLIRQGAHNIGVRLALARGDIDPRELGATVPLYGSYRAMAVANGVPADDPALQPCRDDDQLIEPLTSPTCRPPG